MADNIDIDVEEELEENIELGVDEAFVEAVSPRASVVATPSGALITITDIEGTTSVAVSNGAKGDTGVGITSLYVSEENYHLYVELTTGETVDTGVSIRGAQGVQGETGVGVSSAYVDESSHLIIELTDGTQVDTGQSIKGDTGETGNGIASVSIDNDGYLHMTFTDESEYTSTVSLFGQVQDVIVNGNSVVGNTGEAEFDVPDNLVNGSAIGSLRGVGTTTEGQAYTIGQYATTLGVSTWAPGNAACAQGAWTKASNDGAHAEGNSTTASGLYAHTEGGNTNASADYAHAEGYHTKASSRKQHVFGQYNIEDSIGKYVEIVGNGSSGSESNARTLDWYGHETLSDTLTVSRNATSPMEVVTKQQLDNIDVPVKDVLVNGESVVDSSGNANIDIPIITKTVTGNPIVVDDADGAVQALDVELLPVQDLHGYDKPWSAGAGKNKLNPDFSAWDTTGTYLHINGVVGDGVNANMTFADKDTSVSLTGISMGWVYEDVSNQNAGHYRWCISNGTMASNTTNESNNIAEHKICSNIFVYPNTQETFDKLFARYNIQVELGTTPTSYEPYTNICPITGRTQTDVVDRGVNQFNGETVDGYIDNNTGNVGGHSGYQSTEYIPVFGGQSYYIKSSQTNSAWGAYYDANKTYISGVTQYANSVITVPSNARYMRLTVKSASSGDISTFAVNYPSTDHDYHTYNGQTYSVTLPHTVYGADVDVTGGESKETWQNIASYNGETISEPWLSSMDEYVQGATPTTGAQVTYKLATPTDLQTTPTDIALFKGDNVVSGDGDMTMTYARNLQKIIDKLGI